MLLSPDQYPSASVFELLLAADRGEVGFDRRLLHAILDRGEEAAEDLHRFALQASEKDDDERVVLDEDLLRMFRHLRTPRAVPFLVWYARRLKYEFLDELTEAFAELGEAALEALVELYEASRSPDVSFALAALGVRDPRIFEVLTGELNTSPFEAAISLGHYGDPAAKLALEEALRAAEDPDLRREIRNALEQIERGAPPEPLPKFDIWPLYPEAEAPDFGLLSPEEVAEFLDSPVADYRARAAHALANLELSGDLAARLFQAAENDPDPGVRGVCWEALTGSLEESGVRDAMLARLADAAAPLEERTGALVGLAADMDASEVRRWALEFYRRPETRADAVRAMWRSMDRRFGEYIPPCLDDPDPEVREQAVLAVGWLGLAAQVGRLERLFDDEDLREPALYAYALAAPAETSPAHLRRLLGRIEQLAGGLSDVEAHLVEDALDTRLEVRRYRAASSQPEQDDETAAAPAAAKVGRNDPCPCRSGKKYKKCCGR